MAKNIYIYIYYSIFQISDCLVVSGFMQQHIIFYNKGNASPQYFIYFKSITNNVITICKTILHRVRNEE